MACSLKLVRLDDFTADIDSVDLIGAQIELADEGYHQAVAGIGATSVRESITLKITGTSKDDLATLIQSIDEKIKQVQWWMEQRGVEPYQVWIRAQLDNESLPRQAQIITIEPPSDVRVFNPVEARANYIGEYTLGIERSAFWEDSSAYPATTPVTGLDAIGGMAAVAQTINGDVPARIPKLSIYPGAGGYYQLDYYIGWRSNRLGDPSNFVPVWSCSDGQVFDFSSDTTLGTDSTAYSGTAATCTFAYEATLRQRVGWMVSDVAGNPNDQRGEYQVLLRARMSDNVSMARVRMLFGFGYMLGAPSMAGPINPTYRSRVVIDGSKIPTTNWSLFELGTVQIPPTRIETSASLDNFAIQLDAERISGTGNLLLDCLVLIPSAEGFIHTAFDILQLSSSDALNIYQYADGSINALGYDGTLAATVGAAVFTPIRWGLPAESSAPYVIVAAQRYGGVGQRNISVKGDLASLAYIYIPRFRTLRGNVT